MSFHFFKTIIDKMSKSKKEKAYKVLFFLTFAILSPSLSLTHTHATDVQFFQKVEILIVIALILLSYFSRC